MEELQSIKKRFNRNAGIGSMPMPPTDLYTLIEIVEKQEERILKLEDSLCSKKPQQKSQE